MKSLCWVLSILALLVISTLDARPDPPAVSPGATTGKILTLHQHSGGAASVTPAAVWTNPDSNWQRVLADVPAFRPVDQPDFTALASDPSPPLT
jgi:hypothetical protein